MTQVIKNWSKVPTVYDFLDTLRDYPHLRLYFASPDDMVFSEDSPVGFAAVCEDDLVLSSSHPQDDYFKFKTVLYPKGESLECMQLLKWAEGKDMNRVRWYDHVARDSYGISNLCLHFKDGGKENFLAFTI